MGSYLEELVANAHSLVGLRDRSASLALQSGNCSYRVYVLWDDHALVVHLIDHVRFAVGNVEDVFPEGDLPHVSSHPSQVPHHLSHCIHAIHSIGGSDWCQPRRALQCLQNIILLRLPLKLDHRKMQMSQIEWTPCCHGRNVKFRYDRLSVRTLVGRNVSFRDDGIDEARLVALPRISTPSKQHNSRFLDSNCILKCSNSSANSGCVAAHHSRRAAVEILLIITLGDK